MTEYRPYQPDQTPLSATQERLVFVDPADAQQREFDVLAHRAQSTPIYGADSPEVNEAVEDAYRSVEAEREEAAANTAEHQATDAELARAIDWNAQAVEATREHVETYGF